MSDHSYNIKSCVITNGHQQVIRPMSYGTFNQTKNNVLKMEASGFRDLIIMLRLKVAGV